MGLGSIWEVLSSMGTATIGHRPGGGRRMVFPAGQSFRESVLLLVAAGCSSSLDGSPTLSGHLGIVFLLQRSRNRKEKNLALEPPWRKNFRIPAEDDLVKGRLKSPGEPVWSGAGAVRHRLQSGNHKGLIPVPDYYLRGQASGNPG
jgi:hypothetical protein